MKCRKCGKPVALIQDRRARRAIIVDDGVRMFRRCEEGTRVALNVNGEYIRGEYLMPGEIASGCVPVFRRHSETCKGG